VAVVRLATKKPWAIDATYFTPCRRPLYLTDMAVAPAWQGKGVGRVCMDQAIRLAETWPGDAIRLDAYGAPAGAAAFYFKCGFVNRGRVTYRGTPLVYYELLLSRAKQVRPNKRLKLTGARKRGRIPFVRQLAAVNRKNERCACGRSARSLSAIR